MSARIVVVDDSPVIQRMLTMALGRIGADVGVAGDGEEGLQLVRKQLPRIVFADVSMPTMDGFDMCSAILADHSIDPKPFIIMLTGEGQERDRERALSIGVDQFITKPFSPHEVLELVNNVLGA